MQPQKIPFRLRKSVYIAIGCLFFLAPPGGPAAHAFWWSRSSQPPSPPVSSPVTAVDKEQQVEIFITRIRQIAQDLASSHQGGDSMLDPLAEGVVVSSFVELKKLSRTSSFGRYLSEQLMSEFQRQGYRVMELRKSVSIRVQEERGEYALSRDPAEIPSRVRSGALLTGTYTVAEDHILVNARLLDDRTAALLASATAVFPKDDLARSMLSDRVSAGGPGGREEVVYLKRLEP